MKFQQKSGDPIYQHEITYGKFSKYKFLIKDARVIYQLMNN